MLSKLLIQRAVQSNLHTKETSFQLLNQAIILYQHFLMLLLLHPNQPLTPNSSIDAIFHKQFTLTKSRQDCLPFAQGFIQHQPCEDSDRIWQSFLQTATRLNSFGSGIAEEFLANGPGACEILYCSLK